MKRKRQYRWYVEPLDEHSNRKVADSMEHNGIADADAQPAVVCNDGQARALWECPRRVITKLEHSCDSNFRYQVWVSEGRGKPRPCPWHKFKQAA